MFKIEDVEFEIEESGIVGLIDDWDEALFWAVDVNAKSHEYKDLGYYSPKISFTKLPHVKKSNKKLDKLIWESAEAYDTEEDDWIGDLYLFDGHFFRSRLELVRNSFDSFNVEWIGEVDISYETSEKRDFIPFHIKAIVPFHGFLSDYDNERETKSILKKFCDLKGYTWFNKEDNPFFSRSMYSTRPRPFNL
jgi:hypothetical protein